MAGLFATLSGVISGVLTQLRVLFHMLLSPVRGETHQDRLESFYKHQASGYDSFRKKLLHGREFIATDTPRLNKGIWIDMGGGTGINVQNMADQGRLDEFSKIYIVDLTPSLLGVARERIEKNGWKNVEAIEGDATAWIPSEGMECADLVTFTYSLSMIPDWFAAVEHAQRLLSPRGLLTVVDFYVSRKYPVDGMVRHNWFSRTLWPAWFANDNVNLSMDILPFLRYKFQQKQLHEHTGPAPIVSFLTYPYYIFVGSKKPSKP